MGGPGWPLEHLVDALLHRSLQRQQVTIDAAYVGKMLADIVKDQDLSRYIL